MRFQDQYPIDKVRRETKRALSDASPRLSR